MRAENAIARDHRPIYIQVAETLRARILSGYYTEMLEGEIKLAQEWQVSRRTIQQAIEILVQEGLINRQRGAGTFINPHGVAKRYGLSHRSARASAPKGSRCPTGSSKAAWRKPTRARSTFFRLRRALKSTAIFAS